MSRRILEWLIFTDLLLVSICSFFSTGILLSLAFGACLAVALAASASIWGPSFIGSKVKALTRKYLKVKQDDPNSQPTELLVKPFTQCYCRLSETPEPSPIRYLLSIKKDQVSFESPKLSGGLILEGCRVVIILKKETKNYWKKKHYLQLKHDIRPLFGESKFLYIFFENRRELEEVYCACVRSSKGHLMSSIDKTFSDLHGRLGVNPSGVDGTWFSAVLHRLFFHYHDDPKFYKILRKEFEEIFEKLVQKPNFPKKIINIKVEDVSFGPNMPLISDAKLLQLRPEGTLTISCVADYFGGFYLKLEVLIAIPVPGLPPKILPVEVGIVVDAVKANLVLHFNGPPSSCFWIGLANQPKVKLSIESDVGLVEKQLINLPQLSSIFKKAIKFMLCKFMVLPKMEDFSYPKLKSKKGGSSTNKPGVDYGHVILTQVEADLLDGKDLINPPLPPKDSIKSNGKKSTTNSDLSSLSSSQSVPKPIDNPPGSKSSSQTLPKAAEFPTRTPSASQAIPSKPVPAGFKGGSPPTLPPQNSPPSLTPPVAGTPSLDTPPVLPQPVNSDKPPPLPSPSGSPQPQPSLPPKDYLRTLDLDSDWLMVDPRKSSLSSSSHEKPQDFKPLSASSIPSFPPLPPKDYIKPTPAGVIKPLNTFNSPLPPPVDKEAFKPISASSAEKIKTPANKSLPPQPERPASVSGPPSLPPPPQPERPASVSAPAGVIKPLNTFNSPLPPLLPPLDKDAFKPLSASSSEKLQKNKSPPPPQPERPLSVSAIQPTIKPLELDAFKPLSVSAVPPPKLPPPQNSAPPIPSRDPPPPVPSRSLSSSGLKDSFNFSSLMGEFGDLLKESTTPKEPPKLAPLPPKELVVVSPKVTAQAASTSSEEDTSSSEDSSSEDMPFAQTLANSIAETQAAAAVPKERKRDIMARHLTDLSTQWFGADRERNDAIASFFGSKPKNPPPPKLQEMRSFTSSNPSGASSSSGKTNTSDFYDT